MYKCYGCGHIFEDGEQAIDKEYMGEFQGSPAFAEHGVCPVCGEAYGEIKPCKICGSYEHEHEEDFCEECKKDVMKRFNNLIKQNFTDAEIEFLKEQEEDGLL